MLTSDNLDRLVRAIENSRPGCVRRHSRVVDRDERSRESVVATIRVLSDADNCVFGVRVWMIDHHVTVKDGRELYLVYHDFRTQDDLNADEPDLFLAGGEFEFLERKFDPEGGFSPVITDVLADLGLIMALPDGERDVGPLPGVGPPRGDRWEDLC
jgi:hypothetical protein